MKIVLTSMIKIFPQAGRSETCTSSGRGRDLRMHRVAYRTEDSP
jgi:hypothetical protein